MEPSRALRRRGRRRTLSSTRLVLPGLLALLAAMLAGCAPPKITGSGGDRVSERLAGGKDVQYDVQYWTRTDRSIAIMAVWDARSDTYRRQFKWKGKQEDGCWRTVVLWNESDAVAFGEDDYPGPGKAEIVHFTDSGAVAEVMDASAAERLYGDITGKSWLQH